MPTPATTPLLVIKSKAGELEAVSKEPAAHAQVMVELLPGVRSENRVGKQLVDVAVDAVAEGNPIWLDTTWLPTADPRTSTPPAELTDFDNTLDDVIQEMIPGYHEPLLIPVVAADAAERQLRAMRNFLEHKPRPVVVRTRHGALTGVEPWARIERIATALRVAPDELHLVFDEGYVPAVEDRRVHDLSATITGVADRHECASIAVLGGSTPTNRRNYETHTRQRTEVRLWKAVQAECGYVLRYGDYGVVHPIPPPRTKARFTPNPYLHYTVPGGVLSLARKIPGRNGGAVPAGAAEWFFREVADELVQRPEFAGPNFSWGDAGLYSCRSRTTAIGHPTKWIALATSHHLAHLSRGMEVEQV